jgi:hypothetical protein
MCGVDPTAPVEQALAQIQPIPLPKAILQELNPDIQEDYWAIEEAWAQAHNTSVPEDPLDRLPKPADQ